MIEELLFFSKLKFSEKSKEDLITNKISLGLLMKRSTEYLTGDIDEVVLQVVYGNMRQPPGDQNSPSVKLMTMQPEEKLEDSLTGSTFCNFYFDPLKLVKKSKRSLFNIFHSY